MKVALLGSKDTFHVAKFIESNGDSVICIDKPVTLGWLKENKVEFIVSYGYGYILKPNIIKSYSKRAINLHISYLPWGRGRSPLFWDLMEGNPTGVTIHYLDEGIDTGDIIVQERVFFNGNETFRQAFARLSSAVESLLFCFWGVVRTGRCLSYKQSGCGSYHTPEEMEEYNHLFFKGWDTPISSFAKVEVR